MYNEMTFGKCLKFFLSTLNLRMSQLARAINVDNSLISLWVHEKRFPSTVYFDNIVEYLLLNITNPLQVKLINELFNSLPANSVIAETSLKEKIHEMLLTSLNYSHACKEEEKNSKSTSFRTKHKILEPSWDVIDLSRKDKLIYGTPSIFSACISLLELAKQYKRKENNVIYITYHGVPDYHYFTDKRINYLRNLCLEVINNDWQIIFLLRLDDNIERVIKFITFVLPLIKTGKVNLYYLTNYESFVVRKELYIVSGIGALSCFPTDAYSGANCAFFLRNKSAVEVFANYAKLLITNNANDIIKFYNEDTRNEYFCSLAEINEKSGNQFCYNSSFSKLLIPEKLYKKFINKTDLTEHEKTLSIYYHQKQASGFFKNLLRHQYKHIYFMSTLEELCEDKIIHLYTYGGIKIIHIDSLDVIEYLKYALNIIKKYENYHLAITFEGTEETAKNLSFFIKERKSVHLNVFEPAKEEAGIHLSINEPTIVKACVEYYNSLWKKIPFLHKEKQEVILLLESYIDIIYDGIC